ncbi:unnamed protein product [Urochloa decumbens]|uniref:F-box domain-containing protein n=1 Tax=Urochloa decumbens TaxID=240449 RepID=A0ABC9FLP9_9POAL
MQSLYLAVPHANPRLCSHRSAAADKRGMAPLCPPPELVDDTVTDILLRLSPDEPVCLFRASLVCKPWRRLLTDAAFLCRYHAFHRALPLLGFLHKQQDIGVGYLPRFVYPPRFVPTITPTPFSKCALDGCAGWSVLDCRHGRVLFGVPVDGTSLVIWDPITGKQQQLPKPPVHLGGHSYNAAVLCVVRGCDHLHCHGGPFLVVVVVCGYVGMQSHLYYSEAGAWNSYADVGLEYLGHREPSVLIGDDVYFINILRWHTILKYNLGKNCSSIIQPPVVHNNDGGIALMPMEDGLLGLAYVLHSKLCLWSRNPEEVAGWVEFRTIELEALIPFKSSFSIKVVGSAEGIGIIFVTTDVGVFTIELKSGQVRKVGKHWECFTVFPFMSFYTPGTVITIEPAEVY